MVESIANNFDMNGIRNVGALPNSNGMENTDETTTKPVSAVDEYINIGENGETSTGTGVEETNETEREKPQATEGQNQNEGELSEDERRELEELKATDRKVRQHEMAHLAASQGIAMSGANFEYKRGPDGVNYAVGGDVKIDVSKESDPEKTVDKARRIVTAALAPADPSPQDRQVAARARMMELNAQMELQKERQKEAAGTGEDENVFSMEEPEKPGMPQADTGVEKTGAPKLGFSGAGTGVEDKGAEETVWEQTHPGIETYNIIQFSVGASSFASRMPFLDMVA
jgi:hypothetical protein